MRWTQERKREGRGMEKRIIEKEKEKGREGEEEEKGECK